MKHIVCSFVLCVSSIVWFSCQRDNKIQRNQVDSIVFYAMPKGVDRPFNLVSFQELKNGGKDTLITDTHFIRRFSRLVNRLAPDANRESIDIRSAAVVKMKTGDSLVIAFGEKWGTVILNDLEGDNMSCDSLGFRRVHGVYMKDNAELFRFIDKYVYGPHSNDYWLDDVTRGWVKYVRDVLPEQRAPLFNSMRIQDSLDRALSMVDSRDDQESIVAGVKHAKRNNYRNKRK